MDPGIGSLAAALSVGSGSGRSDRALARAIARQRRMHAGAQS
ncbi:MAG: hypothetical protein ACHQDD_04795 [Steroidobacterales bacterium]